MVRALSKKRTIIICGTLITSFGNQHPSSAHLVEWVVNAGGLQVGSDIVQKSVVLFGVRQGWILVVGFNVGQQRPGKGTVTVDVG